MVLFQYLLYCLCSLVFGASGPILKDELKRAKTLKDLLWFFDTGNPVKPAIKCCKLTEFRDILLEDF